VVRIVPQCQDIDRILVAMIRLDFEVPAVDAGQRQVEAAEPC
jgi:hypothetical protein